MDAIPLRRTTNCISISLLYVLIWLMTRISIFAGFMRLDLIYAEDSLVKM
jgi:hypothetical protein